MGKNFRDISKINVKTVNIKNVEEISSNIFVFDSDVSIKENVNIFH